MIAVRGRRGRRRRKPRTPARQQGRLRRRNSGSANDRRARDLTRMLDRRKARMAEGSGGLGHLVTPADRLARIAHDPQHVGERQLAGCGCFLPHLLVCTAGRSRRAPSARPFSTVSGHRGIARLIENRGPCGSASGSPVPQYGTASNDVLTELEYAGERQGIGRGTNRDHSQAILWCPTSRELFFEMPSCISTILSRERLKSSPMRTKRSWHDPGSSGSNASTTRYEMMP